MELSENLKLRLENLPGDDQQEKQVRATNTAAGSDTEPSDEAESQMRKALGLLGEGQRHRSDPERSEQPHRVGDRFSGGLHRRRFVQDGDIPVTVLRRDQGHEVQARGAASAAPPTSSRLQRTEAALAAETAARERAERSLAEIQALAHDLRTKIGHAELAKNEAVEALQRERDVIAQLRADAHASEERLQEALGQVRGAEQVAQSCENQLADERHARKAAEKALRLSESARETAEQLVRALSEETPAPRRVEVTRRPHTEPEVVAATTSRRPRAPEVAAAEPEPVKWWLNPKPAGKRR
jgi:DNA repair exonuclease SbcCD ATPase subunit